MTRDDEELAEVVRLAPRVARRVDAVSFAAAPPSAHVRGSPVSAPPPASVLFPPASFAPQGASKCPVCRREVSTPGICSAACRRALAKVDERDARALAVRRAWAPPPALRRCTWGSAALRGAVLGGAPMVHALRAQLCDASASGPIVLVGPNGVGKSSLAAAWAMAIEGSVWAPAYALEQADLMGAARSARALVIDGLGGEIAGAPPRSPLASVRGRAAAELLLHAPDQLARLVVTTTIGVKGATVLGTAGLRAAVAGFYGGDAAAKLFDRGRVLMLAPEAGGK